MGSTSTFFMRLNFYHKTPQKCCFFGPEMGTVKNRQVEPIKTHRNQFFQGCSSLVYLNANFKVGSHIDLGLTYPPNIIRGRLYRPI